MPPRPFTPGERGLLGQWGSIINAVSDRVGTAELAARVAAARQAAAEQLGMSEPAGPGFDAIDLGGIRSLAAGYRNAMETFARASDDAAVTPAMMGTVPWSRTLQEISSTPIRVEVRAQYTMLTGGALGEGGSVGSTQWITHTYEGNLPGTVGEIRDDLQAAVDTAAEGYGGEAVQVGDLWVARV